MTCFDPPNQHQAITNSHGICASGGGGIPSFSHTLGPPRASRPSFPCQPSYGLGQHHFVQLFGDATAAPKAGLDGVHHAAVLFQLVNDDRALQLLKVAVKLVLQPQQVGKRCNKSTRKQIRTAEICRKHWKITSHTITRSRSPCERSFLATLWAPSASKYTSMIPGLAPLVSCLTRCQPVNHKNLMRSS